MSKPDRPVFVLTLRPSPGNEGWRELKGLFKLAARRLGMTCLSKVEPPLEDKDGQ